MKKISAILIFVILIQIFSVTVYSIKETGSIFYDDINFEKHIVSSMIPRIGSIQVNDIDNDGLNDFIGAAYDAGLFWWKINPEDSEKWIQQNIDDDVSSSSAVSTIDIDKDGDIDIIGTDWQDDKLILYYNEGGNPISWSKQILGSDFSRCQSIVSVDIDNDMDYDIVATAYSNKVSYWRNEGGTPINFVEKTIENKNGFTSVFATDIDNDGDVDVLGSSWDRHLIGLWENQGGDPIVWNWQLIKDNFKGAHSVYSYDVDSDGDMDAIGAAYTANEVTLFLNNGDNPVTWNEQIIDDFFFRATTVSCADFDLDGDGDVISASQEGSTIYLWWNMGNDPIEWEKQEIASSFNGAWPLYVKDVDKDNDIDIIGGANYIHEIAWWENSLYPVKSDLDSEGKLAWTNVKPGSEITGSFSISNIGLPETSLKWDIVEYPSWGTWTFTPDQGNDLTPEMGSLIIDVTIVAPIENNEAFSGDIRIINEERPDDIEIISVSLSTARNKQLYQTIDLSNMKNLFCHKYLLDILLLFIKNMQSNCC